MRRLAALGAVLGSLLFAAPAAAEQLTVMSFNVWYGGVQVEFDRIGAAIEASGADVVGVQEPEGQLRRIAEAAGMGSMTMTTADLGRLPPGRYVAGLFMDDGYALLARTRFKIARSG